MGIARCLLCQSENTRPYWETVWQAPESRVHACAHCGLFFLWPRMTADQQRTHYTDYGDHLVKRGVTPAKETAAEGFCRCETRQRYRFERLLPIFTKPATFLEIGAGYGNFMGRLIEKGVVADAAVVESNPERLAFVRQRFGITGYGALEQIRGRRFDVVLMFHVLEHVDRPLEFISRCKRLLNDGGRMVIEVPSASDPLLSIYDCGAYKDFYFQPMHPAVYSRPALTYLMTRCGLRPHRWFYEQRYGLANHLHWLSSGAPGGDPELERFLGESVNARYTARLRRQRQTDTIIGVFQDQRGPGSAADPGSRAKASTASPR